MRDRLRRLVGDFKKLANDLAALVAQNGADAVAQREKELEDLRITLKENIQVAAVVRIEAADGDVLDSYLHVQGGRGVNGVLVQLDGGTSELAHDIAVHIAFARPKYLATTTCRPTRSRRSGRRSRPSPATRASPSRPSRRSSRAACRASSRTVCLLEQPYAKDDKLQIKDLLGGAKVVRWAQVEIG